MDQPPVAPEGYEILRELGRGGMGIVYEARQVRLDRRVALKVMIAGREGSPELLHRFVQEARSAARLQHPHIVQVYEAGVEGSLHYFTMDVVEGEPVSNLVRRGPLTVQRAVALARQVALALDYAHSQGVLHRDVKPANILLDAGGEPRIVDFGLAKILQVPGTTVQGVGLGTPAYAAPEQLNGEIERIGPRSDVYSVGATLYELLTGRPPFTGDNDFAVFVSVLQKPPDPPRGLCPTLPADVETIVLKCLEKEPERRYGSALALAEDLGRFLDGEPIDARPVSRISRFAFRLKRRPSVAIAVIVALLAVVSIGLWFAVRRAETARRVARALSDAHQAEENIWGCANAPIDESVRLAIFSHSRDALLDAVQADPENRDARAALARAEAVIAASERTMREERDRAAREAAAAEEVLRKSQLVSAVLSRWARIHDAILGIERATHSFKMTDEEIDAEVERQWVSVDAFADETPDDPTSQATMRAFLAWAFFLDGAEEDALKEVQEAAALDADVPYGSFIEAMFLSDEYLMKGSMSRLKLGGQASSPDLEAIRQQVRALIDRGEKARVWGAEGAQDFRAAFQGIDATVSGETAAAEAPLSRAIESPDLKAFRVRFLFLRALARAEREEYDGAMRDLDEVETTWPEDETVDGVRAAIRTLRLARVGKGGTLDPNDVKELGEMLALVQDAPELAGNPEMRGHMSILQAALAAEQGKDTRAQYRDGIRDLTVVLENAPGNSMARMSRATGWLGLAKLQERFGEASRESYAAALVDFDAAVEAQPRSFPARSGRAAARDAAGDAEGAIEDFREVVTVEPKNVMAWERIAALSRASGDLEAAEEAIGKALAIQPNRLVSRRERGLLRVARGDWTGALEDLDAVLGTRPDDLEALSGRAAVWRGLGDPERAQEDEGRAATARGTEAKALCERSAEKLGKGDLAGAATDASKAIELMPEEASGYLRRAAVRSAMKEHDGAAADCDAAIRLGAEGTLPFTIRAAARMAKGDFAGAIDDYGEVLRQEPKSAVAYHNRGRAWHEAKDYDRAIADYGEAIRRSPRMPEAWANLGRARRDKGDPEAARSYFKTCLEVAPSDWAYRKTVEGWIAELDGGE